MRGRAQLLSHQALSIWLSRVTGLRNEETERFSSPAPKHNVLALCPLHSGLCGPDSASLSGDVTQVDFHSLVAPRFPGPFSAPWVGLCDLFWR